MRSRAQWRHARRSRARLAQAQPDGALRFVNIEYAKRRQAAVASGKRFLRYSAVQARLRNGVAEIAAGKDSNIIAQVFGG